MRLLSPEERVNIASPIKVFSPEYIPETIRHRDKQLSTLLERSKGLRGTFCEGERSTGKTVTAKRYLETVDQTPGHTTIYFSTDRAILLDFRTLVESKVRKLKKLETPFKVFFENATEHIDFVFDDTQKVYSFRVFNSFLHSLFEHAAKLDKSLHLVLVGTQRYPDLVARLGADVQSRFQFYPVLFSPYDAVEMAQIFRDRLTYADLEFDEGAVAFVASKVRRLASDLRLGLQILENALPLIEDKLTLQVVETAWEKTKTDYWRVQIVEMDEHTRYLLYSATKVASKMPKQPAEVRTGDIIKAYVALCSVIGVEPLYAERVHYLLKKLVKTGWLTKIGVESRGRYGVSTVFQFEMNPDTILKSFQAIKPEELEAYQIQIDARSITP